MEEMMEEMMEEIFIHPFHMHMLNTIVDNLYNP